MYMCTHLVRVPCAMFRLLPFHIFQIFFILQIGINCERDRAAIMLAVENYLAEVKLNESSRSPIIPSAPLEEASTSSQNCNFVQNINMTECVICLDSQVSTIFIYPCTFHKFYFNSLYMYSLNIYLLYYCFDTLLIMASISYCSLFAVRSDFSTMWSSLLLLHMCRQDFCRMSYVQELHRA